MTIRTRTCLVAALLLSGLQVPARADFIIYDLGSLGNVISKIAAQGRSLDQKSNDNRIVLPGKVVVNPGGTVSYTHTNGTQVHFQLGEVEIKRASTAKEQFNKLYNSAKDDPDALMKAGIWALKKALLTDFHKAVDKVLTINPRHEAALLVVEMRKKLKESLPDDPQTEKTFRSLVKGASGMRIEKSAHFMLMTDTPEKPPKGKKKNRAQERLALLEKVYESFVLLFHAQDVQLDIPKERMMVVLFKQKEDFKTYSETLSPTLSSAEGFWHPITNVSYFFDYGTSEQFEFLKSIMVELKKLEADAKRSRDPDTIRYVKVLDLLMEVERENSDVSVVSHECCHQMAGNTGLFPRHVDNPRWVHEGLATYFEAPSGGAWAGIGAVSTERLIFYRMLLERQKEFSSVDVVVSDALFEKAGNSYTVLQGYAQAWALTHFLFEMHLKEFVSYYRMIGEMPPDVQLSPDLLMEIFSRAFGSDHQALDTEWKAYMRTIKTDMEILEESAN